MNFRFKNENYQKLLSIVFCCLFFLSLSLIININFAQAADFEVNVGSTEWKVNNTGIYKNNTKIYCSDIQTGVVPSDDGFLIKNSSDDKLFLMTNSSIHVSARDPFSSLSYPGGISDSFILKESNDSILFYVDGYGLHYKDGLCDDDNYTCVDPLDDRVCLTRDDSYCNYGCESNSYANWAIPASCGTNPTTCGCCDAQLQGSWNSCHWEYPGGTSFKENTIIDTKDGSKKILDIKKGDIVKSYDEVNHEIVFTEVLNTRTHFSESYFLLNFKIEVTGNHEFYIDGEWIPVENLRSGDKLFDGKKDIPLWSIIKIDEAVMVYNFDTEAPYDNYFAEGILVHNDNDESCEPPNSLYSDCVNTAVTYCNKDYYGTSNEDDCCEYGGVHDVCEGDPTDICSDYNASQPSCVGHGCLWEVNPNHPCGNGVIDSGEQCDNPDLNGQDCESQGFWGGDLGCNPATCLFDTSECLVTEPPHCSEVPGGYVACEDVNTVEYENLYYDEYEEFPVTCYDHIQWLPGYHTGLEGCECNWKWSCNDGGTPGQFGCEGQGGFVEWVDDPDDCTGGGGGGCDNYPGADPACECNGTHIEAEDILNETDCMSNGYTWVTP